MNDRPHLDGQVAKRIRLMLSTHTLTFPSLAEPNLVSDERYIVRLARNRAEVESAMQLRHEVFNVELGGGPEGQTGLEFDAYDIRCRHLIVISRESGATVGTYRLNSIETAQSTHGFYAASEFTIEDLPAEVIDNGIEIGRACVSSDHRNTKVLFLLWRGLLAYLRLCGKRYYFGCCSIFSRDENVGRMVFRRLLREAHMHERFTVVPCGNALSLIDEDGIVAHEVELPALFNMYLRIGAKVCGPPMIDREFGTIDFFVVFDSAQMSDKYRKLFS